MENFVARDGLTLAYRDEGAGLPVLALSGLTRNSDDFNFVAPHLSQVRLIRMDYRGRGASDWGPYQTYTVPQEADDALMLLDHLGIERAAILGTSRGGLIAMGIAMAAKDRLLGACLNDIGPVIDPRGLDYIKGFLGRRPSARFYKDAASARAQIMEASGFRNVPADRWEAEVRHLYSQTETGLQNRYDPALREAVLEAGAQPAPDLWPYFDALHDLPLALIHGENSDILTDDTVAEMRRRNPDMRYARVADRGHVPFLDEPEALATLHDWLGDLR